MVKYKNIRISKRGGGSRLQRVQVLASGKYKFVKNKSRSSNPSGSSKRKATRKVRKYMVRRKRKRSGGKSMTQTVFKFVRWGALAAPGVATAMNPAMSGEQKINQAIAWYTGYYPPTGEWKWQFLAKGWMPYIGAVLATYGIPKLTSIIRRL